MKRVCQCLGFAAGIMLCLAISVGALAVVIDDEAPYEGEYLLVYNDNLNSMITVSVSGLPQARSAGSAEEEALAEYDVLAVDVDEQGRRCTRIEFRNMDDVTPADPALAPRRALQRGGVPTLGDEKTFIAVDKITDTAYHKDFTLLYTGQYCNIWLATDEQDRITQDMVAELGMEYDVRIHRQAAQAFGETLDRDGDGKVAFLLYDIQDGYGQDNPDYTGGFFFKEDLVGEDYNRMDVLHIDTYPTISLQAADPLALAKSVMVHELQHLIEQSACMEEDPQKPGTYRVVRTELPLWLNEGLSMAAEHMFYGVRSERIEYYNNDALLTTPLFDWGRGGDVLSNYAYSYLFCQYLRAQTKDFTGGGEALYYQLIHGADRSSACVLEAMRQFYPYMSMKQLLRGFYIALAVKEPQGLYGFAGEPEFNALDQRLHTGSDSVALWNGAGIVRKLSGPYTPPSTSGFHYISVVAFAPGEEAGVRPPEPSLASGKVPSYSYVTFSSCEPFVSIYYTLDGTEPDENSLPYDGASICLLCDTTLKAVAVSPSGEKSAVVERTYTVAQEEVEIYRRITAEDQNFGAFGTAVSPDGKSVVLSGMVKRGLVGTGEFANLTGMGDTGNSGNTSLSSDENCVGYLAKYRLTGELEWMRAFDADATCGLMRVVSVEDGYVAAGFAKRANSGDPHTGALEGCPVTAGEDTYAWFVTKYDQEGNRLWVKTIPFTGGANRQKNYPFGLQRAGDGFLLSGMTRFEDSTFMGIGLPYLDSDNERSGTATLVRLDGKGDLIWKKELDTLGGASFRDACVLQNGNIAAVGYVGKEAIGWGDIPDLGLQKPEGEWGTAPLAAIFSPEGELLHVNAMPMSSMNEVYYRDQHFFSVLALPNGGFATVGLAEDWVSFEDGITSAYRGVVACYDDEAICLWSHVTIEEPAPSFRVGNYCTGLAPAENGFMVTLNYGDLFANTKTMKFPLPLENVTGVSQSDTVAAKYGYDGELMWYKNYYSTFVSKHASTAPHTLVYLGDRTYVMSGEAMTNINSGSNRSSPFFLLFHDESIEHYDLRGSVSLQGGGKLSGVTIGNALTDANGSFRIRVAQGERVLLAPELEGYTFQPASIPLDHVSGDRNDLNFIATPKQYTVKGRVTGADGKPLAGVNVGGVTTGTDGAYTITCPWGATLVLRPELAGVGQWEPAQHTVARLSENKTGLDFRVRPKTYTISGTVTREGKGQGGVCIADGVLTAADGTYSILVEEGKALQLLPKFDAYAFEPASRDFAAVTGDQAGQDFVMKEAATKPDPEKPDPEKPDPEKPDPEKPDPEKPDPEKPDPEKPDPEKPDPEKPDPEKPDPEKPDPEKPAPPSPPSSSGSSGSDSDDDDPAPAKKPEPAELHSPYLRGYPDGTFRPEDTMTRAQCAAMLSRLSPEFQEEKDYRSSDDFSDVKVKSWAANYIAFARQTGVVRGYTDGTFRPDQAMTRAEFATVVRNALALELEAENAFPDTERHWARQAIAQLAQAGILKGYPDGTFRPNEPITRAEAARVLNLAWQRAAGDGHGPDEADYSDLTERHWAYRDICEASVEHAAAKKK